MVRLYDEEEIYDMNDHRDSEIDEFIESLSLEQFDKISNFFASLPQLQHKEKYKCRNVENMRIMFSRNYKIFLVALSYESLMNIIQSNFQMMQHHNYSLSELENMIHMGKGYISKDVITTS